MSLREADRLLRDAQIEGSAEPLYTSDENAIAAAQVEATISLARATKDLVDQQRLANLIEIKKLNDSHGLFTESSVMDEIKEGLRL